MLRRIEPPASSSDPSIALILAWHPYRHLVSTVFDSAINSNTQRGSPRIRRGNHSSQSNSFRRVSPKRSVGGYCPAIRHNKWHQFRIWVARNLSVRAAEVLHPTWRLTFILLRPIANIAELTVGPGYEKQMPYMTRFPECHRGLVGDGRGQS